MDSREDTVHWGQCFDEFYGPEYCKNLKKDLEKLKDEFYDGNARRFQREWVVPTANLLRRLRHMGFPVRTKEFIVIHLYNPVDSMSAGEMHFQVGRKAPGTLTLKFTKQNLSNAFVIQPKTLSNKDEMQLNEDPLGFLEQVRHEMRDTAVDVPNLLRTLVLMTDNCKLERHCATVFFAGPTAEKASVTKPTPHSTPGGVPFANSQLAATLMNPELNSTRPDGSHMPYPPLSFLVKTYVNCNSKPMSEGGHHHLAQATSYPKTGNGPVLVHQQSRTNTWHSEPEENDETIGLQSFNESNWPRTPPTNVEEIRRRMSDARLWEATKTPPATAPDSKLRLAYETTRTSLTNEYTGDSNAAHIAERRPSETRTAATEEYFTGDSGRRASTTERTSLTEDYAGQGRSMGDPPWSTPGSVSPRTAVVDEYAERRVDRGVSPSLYVLMSKNPLADAGDSRRTSSLDAYIGNGVRLAVAPQETRARSETNLAALPVRTNLVDQYLGPPGEEDAGGRVEGTPFFGRGGGTTFLGGMGNHWLGTKDAESSSLPELSGVSLDSWASHCGAVLSPVHRPDDRPRAGSYPRSAGPESADETDVSLLSHTSYPSWASHRCVVADPASAPLPLAIEQINRNSHNWRQWAPPNSLNSDRA